MKKFLASLLIALVTVTSLPAAAVNSLSVYAAAATTKSLEKATITLDSQYNYEYDGTAKEPRFTVTVNGDIVSPSDYDVTWNNNVNASTNKEKASLTVTAKDGSDYTGSKKVEFSIKKASTKINVNNSDDTSYTKTYDGTSTPIPFTVEPSSLQDKASVTYGSGKNASSTAPVDAGTYAVKISLPSDDSNYDKKDWNGRYVINKRNIGHAIVKANPSEYSYTGKAITPTFTVTDLGKTLTEGKDYTVRYENNTNVTVRGASARIIVTGKGNYEGTVGGEFEIEKADMGSQDLSNGNFEIKDIPDQGYTGNAIEPKITVTYKSADGKTTKTLSSGKDYEVSYSRNIEVGTAQVTVKGKGDYTGTLSKNFTIKAETLKANNVSAISNKTYTGFEIEPEVTVSVGGKKLLEDRDYFVSYSNNTDVTDLAMVTIKGNYNRGYSGTVTKTFKIVPHNLNAGDVTISGIDDSYDYDGGKAITPKPIIEVGRIAEPLKEGTDYTLSYSSNTKTGTAKVTITGKGNFTGTVTQNFEIEESTGTISIFNAVISDIKDVSYNGNEQKPSVTVRLNGTALRSGKDYKVTYYNNVNAGQATVSVRGTGDYKGSVKKYFTIKPISISRAAISSIPAQKYTGFAIKPSVTVSYGGKTLEEDIDYRLSYSGNTNVGTGKVTVNGLRNFEGSVVKTFTISENAEPTPVPTDNQFSDVTNKNSYYYDAVYALYDEGVVKGTTTTTFAPLKTVTRAEFVQMLYNKALALYKDGKTSSNPASVRTTSKFDDVSSGAWYAKAVSWAVANDITAGKTEDTFAPNDTVTRAESVQFLKNMVAPNESASGRTSFTDVPEDKWYAKAVSWAVNEGVASGRTSTIFAPEATTVRADAAVLINNAKDLF